MYTEDDLNKNLKQKPKVETVLVQFVPMEDPLKNNI